MTSASDAGTARVAGTIVWATDLIESRSSSGGGKGSPKVTSFSYSSSFAVALSSRPIARVGRIWADGQLLRGTVRSIAPTLDTTRRIAIVYVDLPGAQQQGAKAGMYVSGRFDLGQTGGWMIPHSAVVSRDGFDFIFLLGADQRVRQHKVTLGARQGDLVQVLDGVDGQTRLVRSGAGFLIDGDLVKVVATPAATATAASQPVPAASSASR